MHLFGAWGAVIFIIGFITAIGIGATKLYKLWYHIPDILVTQNPWFYIALTVMILGTLLFIAGFFRRTHFTYSKKSATLQNQ